MPEQPLPAGAVFLSYASEDADAAARICEALRAAGVEVWFDRSELRGGDAWDSQIKKQIHDCALFVPLISAHTNARSEGYFRGEWHLATRRLHNMADDAAFLVPVVVDDTREADARVPEEFLRAQWTWLMGGETPPAFARRVRQLLGLALAPAPSGQEAAAGAIEQSARSSGSVRPPGVPLVWRVGLALIPLLLVLGAGAFWYFQGARDGPAATPTPAGVSTEAVAAPNEKSIAVLPFADLSPDKDQEYFADGLSEELIDHLAQITELKVIARSSSFAFKGVNEDARSIATKLGVTNLLQGSVRRAGSQLRITAQLIRASDGVLLWSQTFVRKLDDIFKVQDEISTMVAMALNATLNPTTAVREETAANRTTNIEAYNLLLQGNFFYWRGYKGDEAKAVKVFQQALKLDPQYAVAWAKLARVYGWQGYIGDLTAAEAVVKSRDAVERALAIDPDCAEAYFARGNIFRLLVGDWTAAMSDYKRAAVLDPYGQVGIDAQTTALILEAETKGQFNALLDWLRRRLERDPLDTSVLSDLAWAQQFSGHMEESAATSLRLLEVNPNFSSAWAQYSLTLLFMGKNAEALAAVAKEPDNASKLEVLSDVYWALGRRAESDSALSALERGYADRKAYEIAATHAYRGEADAAFAWLDRAHQHQKGSLVDLKIDPRLQNLRGDPRFGVLLRKAKLA